MSDELKIGQKLGEGACWVVYKGIWKEMLCSIKMLKQGFIKGTQEYRDIITELSVRTQTLTWTRSLGQRSDLPFPYRQGGLGCFV
jgi:hypothetical protein